jgi:phenylacetate-coenzyme A ligase PaaK-like adenylate-forming protein
MPVTVLQSEEESFSNLHYDLARTVGIARFRSLKFWESPYILAVTDNTSHLPFCKYNPILEKWCRFVVMDALLPKSVLDVLHLIEELQPAILVSRPSALRILADTAAQEPIKLPESMGVISSGANLYSDDRERIASALHAEIADLYAITECSGVASQCLPYGSYHVHWEQVLVEVIDPCTELPVNGEEPGEIIVTDLSRRLMPIIRYRTGDGGRWNVNPCPCGRSGPTLKTIDGRDACYFPLKGGHIFNPSILNAPLSALTHLKQFRLIQTQEDTVLMEFVPTADAPSDLSALIKETIACTFPCSININCRKVSRIGDPGVKVQRYVSLVEAEGSRSLMDKRIII